MNFTVLLPFLLFEYALTISEIAAFLSVLGAADILFRFLAPQVGDCLKQPARIMIILVLLVIIIARFGKITANMYVIAWGIKAIVVSALIYVTHYPTILIIAFVLGCVKGLRVVYMSLVIPSYVPQERLASASAIQIISNSFMSLLGGHAIGKLKNTLFNYHFISKCFRCYEDQYWKLHILCDTTQLSHSANNYYVVRGYFVQKMPKKKGCRP